MKTATVGPDGEEVWFAGFAEENEQLRANHPTLGPDGLIYVGNGLRGGKIVRGRCAPAPKPDAGVRLRRG